MPALGGAMGGEFRVQGVGGWGGAGKYFGTVLPVGFGVKGGRVKGCRHWGQPPPPPQQQPNTPETRIRQHLPTCRYTTRNLNPKP